MVLLEHVGFGGRDRELHLYFWDERDGVDFSGWWVTPDFKGNGEYFLTCGTQAATPDKCERGAWRSPNVEQLQLKRSLDLAFAPDAAAGGLVAAGDDAATPIVPDNIVKVNFSKIVWREDGLHHGRPCYIAAERPVAESPSSSAESASALARHPELAVAIGVAVGVAVVLAAQRLARR